MTYDIRKKRTTFHMVRINKGILRSLGAQRQTQVAEKRDEDSKLSGITEQHILDGNICKQEIKNWTVPKCQVFFFFFFEF